MDGKMTLRNRLVSEAKKKPDFISVRVCDIRAVAKHASESMWCYGMPLPELETKLLAGELKLLGVPLRVGNL